MATTPFHTADALRQRIADAVCHEKIYPAYQPIVCLRTRAIHGLEVLARWHDPDFGAVPPKDFIPIALQASLLPLLTLNLVRRACAEAGTWPGRFCLAFNVPPSLLQDAPAVRLLLEAITRLDRPVIVAYVMVVVVLFVTINLLVDLIYSALDPRVRLTEATS